MDASDAAESAARTFRKDWLKKHDWLKFDGVTCWCEPCRLYPMYANKKSVLNTNGGYRGEGAGGFRYDPIKLHMYNKRTKEINADHAAAVKQWNFQKEQEAGKIPAEIGQQTLVKFVEAGFQEQVQRISKLVNTAHLVL
jgi:hypothetical protein